MGLDRTILPQRSVENIVKVQNIFQNVYKEFTAITYREIYN